ncbi:hypothetical protein QQF64_034029 [Cirrhinus molitorella]|uniref:TRIM8/14/16/25/29/45/65 coiled-coil region domain-containing protein n=1 Tax=Cirrhinus molitorella TaxID=172907 RepID=A0ABR3MVN4_9TELE
MFQQRIQQREKDLKQLREAVESHKLSAQTAVEDSERIFTEHIRSIERRCSEAKQQIRDHEKASVSQAEGLVGGLEQEINDLRRRHAELEQLLQTKDHIYLLKSFQCLSALPECTDIPNIPPSSVFSFDSMRESLHQLRDKLEDFFKEELKKIPDKVTFTNMVPRTRNDFLQYYLQLTLDPNTAHKRLHLSNRNRVPATPPLSAASPSAHPYLTIGAVDSPRVSQLPSALWLEDPSAPPPASESWTPPRPSDPAAALWHLAPSSPSSTIDPLAPPGSLVPTAPLRSASVLDRSGYAAALRISASASVAGATCSALALRILGVALDHRLSASGSTSTCSATVGQPHGVVSPSSTMAPPSIGSAVGYRHSWDLGSPWLLLLQVPPVFSLAPPSG